MLPSRDDCPPTAPLPWSPPSPPALLGGNGLLRMSFSVDDEEDGVRTGDWFEASLVEPIDDGEAVPSLESLFFFDALFGSLPRESYRRQVWSALFFPPYTVCTPEPLHRVTMRPATDNSLAEALHFGRQRSGLWWGRLESPASSWLERGDGCARRKRAQGCSREGGGSCC